MPLQQGSLPTILLTLVLLTSSTKYPHDDSRIQLQGRFYADSKGLRYGWCCSSISFCFANATEV